MKSVLFIIGLILFSSKNFLNGQSYIVEYFGKESGLSDRNITSLQQDNLGYIWIGTLNGSLYRYDGYNFVLFNKYLNLKPSSPIYSIGKTQDGNLWICSDGIRVLNPSTLESKIYYSGTTLYGENSSQQNLFFSFIRTKNNDIWLSSTSGVYVARNANLLQLNPVKIETPLGSYTTQLILDEKDNIWLCDFRSIYKLEEKKFVSKVTFENDFIYPSINLRNRFVGCYSEKTNHWYSMTKENLPSNVVNWNFIRTYYNNIENKLKTLTNNKNQRWFISFTSTDNTIWVGTYAGLFKFTPKNNIFSTLTTLNNHSVRAIYENKHNSEIYFGTYSGIKKYNLKSNQYINISNDIAYTIIAKKENRLLVMSEAIGLIWLNLSSGKKNYITLQEGVTSNSTATFLEGDTLFFGYRGKVYNYNIKDEKLSSHNIDLSNIIDSAVGTIYSIFRYQKHEFWISTSEGVFCMNQNGSIINQSILKNPSFTKDIFIVSFYEDKFNNLWMTSKINGIFKINFKQGLIDHYTQKDGLANDETYGILSNDGGNTLWISTANGLSCFDTSKKQFKNYYENDGLAHNEFNRSAFLATSDSTFYFGGINGVTYFKAKNIKKDSLSFAPFLTRYNIYNSDGKVNSNFLFGEIKDNIELKPNDNIIEFEVSCSDYVDLNKRTYKFFLEGFDKNWVSISNGNNSIRYMNLPAGTYTLFVKAIGGLGEWSRNSLQVKIKVIQPFYKSLWFTFIIFIIFSSLVYAVFKYRLNQIKRYNDIRLSIGSNLHDELGGTLYAINFTGTASFKKNIPNLANSIL